MDSQFVVELGRKTVETVLLVSAPMLISGLLIGLVISIFQAATQINEQTLAFIPKIIAVLVTLLIFAPWMMKIMITFTTGIIRGIATVGH
jgi:flagellar biosynthetic protein FliQ